MIRCQRLFFYSAALFIVLSTILYLFTPSGQSCFDIDSFGYDRIAHYFSKTGNLDDPACPGKATVQTVGYHFFVGVFYKFFGHRYWPIIWFQIFLTLSSCFLVFLISKRLFNVRVAAVSVFLCAVNVGFLVYPQFLLAESLALCLILLFLERYILFWYSQKNIHLVQAGFAGGLSLLVKPSALPFLFFASFFLLFCIEKKNKLKSFFLFVLCFCIPLFGYLSYNKVRYEYFNLAPMTSLNIYHVFLSKVISRVHGISVFDAEKKIPPFSSKNTLDERGWDGARKLFWHYVRNYPLSCFFVWMKNVSKTLFGLFSTQLKVLLSKDVQGGDISFFAFKGSFLNRINNYIFSGVSHWPIALIAFLEAIWSLIRYFLVICAFFILFLYRRYKVSILFFSFIISFSAITGFDGCCRYRILFEPIFIILSSVTLVFFYDLVRQNDFSKNISIKKIFQ